MWFALVILGLVYLAAGCVVNDLFDAKIFRILDEAQRKGLDFDDLIVIANEEGRKIEGVEAYENGLDELDKEPTGIPGILYRIVAWPRLIVEWKGIVQMDKALNERLNLIKTNRRSDI